MKGLFSHGRGGTELSVKITCDAKENVLFGKALMGPIVETKKRK